MTDPLAHWVGRDESEGIPVQPRKDVAPPPHWRLEAIAATERPRSLTLGLDRRHAVFIQDGESSDVWQLDLAEAHPVPQRLTAGRAPMPYWEDTTPQLSPDGSQVSYADDGHVCVVPVSGGPPRRLLEAAEPIWIDDATLLISVERGDTTRLAVVDVADPWPRRLAHAATDHGDEWAPAVSPDRSEVAFVFTPRDDLNRSEIRVAALATGAVRALSGTPRMHDRAPAWSPDGTALAYVSERSGGWALHAVGRDGSGERQLTGDGADYAEPEWHPDGVRILVTRASRNRAGLAVVDAATGAVRELAPGGSWSAPHWTAGDGVIAMYEDHATPPELRLVETGAARSGVAVQPAPSVPRAEASGAAPRSDTLEPAPSVPRAEPSGAAPRNGALLPALSGGAVRTLLAPAPLAIRRAPHIRPEDVTFSSRDGLEIPAFLFHPQTASPERPAAAIVYPHGGPTDAYGDHWDGHAQYFLDKGYAWLALNFRGSTGYGREFERANHGVWGVKDVWDCLAAAEHLRTLDWVDGERLGIFGASYGSYMALLSVTDDPEHRFRCAVAKYGDCDLLSSWSQGDRAGVQDLERMMGHPSTARAAYHAGSPVHRLEQVQAPLLIAHGERDERVSPKQSEELVAALRRLGKTFEYLTYPTEAHGLLRSGPQIHFYRRLERFLDWYLI